MIATIAVMAAIAETKRVQRSQRQDRSYGNHIPAILAIAATTITEIEKNYLSDRVPYQKYDRCHRWTFFFSLRDRSDRIETGLYPPF